jgi:hypothetical protein
MTRRSLGLPSGDSLWQPPPPVMGLKSTTEQSDEQPADIVGSQPETEPLSEGPGESAAEPARTAARSQPRATRTTGTTAEARQRQGTMATPYVRARDGQKTVRFYGTISVGLKKRLKRHLADLAPEWNESDFLEAVLTAGIENRVGLIGLPARRRSNG